jgi:hypothetical protein
MLLSPLCSQLSQVVVEPVHAVLPRATILIQPLGDFLQRGAVEMTRPPLRDARAADQAGSFQHLEMFRHRGRRDRKRFRELFDGEVSLRKARQDSAPRGIGESSKCQTQMVRHSIHHTAN